MTEFSVWAPQAKLVELVLGERRIAMARARREGWWSLDLPTAAPGTDYAFSLDGGPPRPDPRSRRQPYTVHGPSRVVDPGSFHWTDDAWAGRRLAGSIVYELHVGTFTEQGTFDAAADRLDHLTGLGVDFVQLMPIAAFPGRHGWGYDGVAPWSVHEPYGGPAGMQRFVDSCHGRGLGVLLDVVYNHLGPSGNYLAEFGPYFTDRYQTPWGTAVNLDGPGSDEVRAYIVENALYWLRDYHLDGLRLDAVHALTDTRAIHILEELSTAVDRLSRQLGRPLALVAETDLNDPRIVTPREHGGLGVHAQWNDDFHHAVHSLLTGERHGYYEDFGSIAALAKTLTRAYFHDGVWSAFRGRTHGRPIDTGILKGSSFLGFAQNHDQIGNRALGDRSGASLSPGRLRIAATLVLTAPFTPLIFMGEEWGASTPWQYFTDHPEPDLGEAIRAGRVREFSRHGWAGDVPNPQAPETFTRSRLNWAETAVEPYRSLLAWYRALIALRRHDPDLTNPGFESTDVTFDEADRWLVVRRGAVRVVVNLAGQPQHIPLHLPLDTILLTSDTAVRSHRDEIELPAESVAIVRVTPAD